MIRRSPALLLLASVALAGCATWSDNNAAARVGDARLTQSQLDELVIGAIPGSIGPGGDTDVRVTAPLGTVQNLLNVWLITEILTDDVARLGAQVSEEDLAAAAAVFDQQYGDNWQEVTTAGLRDLQIRQQATFDVWSSIDEPVPPDDVLRADYDRGPQVSGIACTAHVLVESADEADEVMAELAAGAEFSAVAAARSIDPGSAARGGALPCTTTADFAQTYIPEFVEAALAATVGVPTDPVPSQFGVHVILVRPFDDVERSEIERVYADAGARFRRAARAVDVHVDPRYGFFDPDAGVTTLGN